MSGPAKRKDLGQHFLRDARIARRIVEAAEVADQHVLEIGPGAGILTDELRQVADQVTCIEFDERFADIIEGHGWSNVTVLRGDALHVPIPAGVDRIVANLPYQISGPITVRLLDRLADPETAWQAAVLMYQREFAQRLVAGPGSKQYGRLSVHAARWCTVSKVRDVAPGCFDPPPKVQSMVVRFDPYPAGEAPFTVSDDAMWRAVVDGSFQQRRKQLHNTVPAALRSRGMDVDAAAVRDVLCDLGIETARPEQVAPHQFAALTDRIVAIRDEAR